MQGWLLLTLHYRKLNLGIGYVAAIIKDFFGKSGQR